MLSTTAFLLLIVLFMFHCNPIATADPLITHPNFSPHDDFFTLGDVAYNPDNRSYSINAGARTPASKGSCGVLRYGKKVHIQNVATGREASFNSSFSSTFTTHGVPWITLTIRTLDGSGFVFAMTQNLPMSTWDDMFSQYGQFGACKISRNQNTRLRPPIFSIEFDTYYNPNCDNESSNNFIRVSKNLEYEYDVEAYTHNLCGNGMHCSYFSNGRISTAWIDFTSSFQNLVFRIANGSTPEPVQPLLLISNYKFQRWIGDEVVLSFSGGSDVNHLEEHELFSWNIFSTGTLESKFQMMLQYLKSKTWAGVTPGVVFGMLGAGLGA